MTFDTENPATTLGGGDGLTTGLMPKPPRGGMFGEGDDVQAPADEFDFSTLFRAPKLPPMDADQWSEDDMKQVRLGALGEAYDHHLKTTGAPPDEDAATRMWNQMLAEYPLPEEEEEPKPTRTAALDTGTATDAPPAPAGDGEQQVAGVGLLWPELVYNQNCTGAGCHTPIPGLPGRPAAPVPPPIIPGSPPADQRQPLPPNAPPAPPAGNPPPSRPAPQPSPTLPGRPAEPVEAPEPMEIKDVGPFDHGAGAPPHPETQKGLDKIPDPEVRKAVENTIFDKGVTNGADEKATNIETKGDFGTAQADQARIIKEMGADPKDVKVKDGVATINSPDRRVTINARPTSSDGTPTLDVQVKDENGKMVYWVKRRYLP